MAEKCLFWIPRYRHQQWQPAVDVYRSGNAWLIKCDLAGVRHEDTQVSLGERQVTVAGVRRDWSIKNGYHAYSIEITYAHFERTIELPCELKGADVRFDYRDGMLLIWIATQEREETV